MNATTEGQKRAVLDMIYQAWIEKPELRLGQLLENAAQGRAPYIDLFEIKDFDLAKKL